MIERTFGVLKKRFKVLIFAQEYVLEDQARLMSALAVVHNFILIHDPNDNDYIEDIGSHVQGAMDRREECVAVSQEESERAGERREQIAQEMWKAYSRN